MTQFRDVIDHAAIRRVRGAGWPTVLRWAALAGIGEAVLVMVAPGTYKYRCDLHSGMTGTLIVR